jgi:hypothetical protein
MTPARDDDYLNGPGLVDLMNVELGRAWATLSELKMRLDRAALGLDPALTLEDVQGIVAAAGSVAAPTGGQTGYLMQATGAGAYGWISRAVALGAALEAVRGLTPAADRLPYFNGPSGAALATLTSFARTLLDDADQATMLATLGAQPAAAILASLAGLASVAAGDLFYATGATTVGRLPKGTARQIPMMKTDASALEYMSVSAPILLATKTASGSASLIFTETNATKFRDYKFRLRGVKPATSGVLQLEVSANGGASWSPSNYQNLIETNVAGGVPAELDQVIAALWSMTGTTTSVSNAANAHGVFGDVMIYEAGATRRTRFNIEHLGYDAPNVTTVVGSGTTNDAVAHNAFRWTYSIGNIASGEIEMFGIP